MLCRKCWTQDASVHFRTLCGGEAEHVAYCLACAQDELWSWLLAWGHGREPVPGGILPAPIAVRSEPGRAGRQPVTHTVVATGLYRCECGCRIVVGAELACDHDAYEYQGDAEVVPYLCHCGREHAIVVPTVACRECDVAEGRPIIGTARTCLWDEQRRRLVGVHEDLQRGHTTWGTFSIKN